MKRLQDIYLSYFCEQERIKKYGTDSKPEGADCFRDDIQPTPGGCGKAAAELAAWSDATGVSVSGILNYWIHRRK